MDSLGDKLKEAREEAGLSIDQVYRDTKISKSFINAIETENFEVFPGETYVIGFIRNYSEYLGFKGDDFVKLYKNLMIQEHQVPIEQLVSSARLTDDNNVKRKLLITILLLMSIGAITVGILFLNGTFSAKGDKSSENFGILSKKGNSFELDGTRLFDELDINDKVNLTETTSGKDFSIILQKIKKDEKIVTFKIFEIESNNDSFIDIEVGKSVLIDLNSDQTNDLKIEVIDFSNKNRIFVDFNLSNFKTTNFLLEDSLITEVDAKKSVPIQTILTNEQQEPLNIIINKAKNTSVSYKIDGESLIFADKNSLNLNAEKGIILWFSNRVDSSLLINNKEIQLPQQEGPASCFFITWKENENEYQLVLYPLNGKNE